MLRSAALHLDRHRTRIEMGVNRRLGRAEPPPAARGEILRRFRSFCRLASIDWNAARPSLDGLAGNPPLALENAVAAAVELAIETGAPEDVAAALRELGSRFRAGIRRALQPQELEGKRRKRSKRPNAGRRVRAAIDRISDAYLALCLETGRIYDVNPAAEALFGGEAADLLSREFVELVGTEDRASYRDLEARLDAGEDSGPTRMTFSRRNGESVPVELSVASHTIGGRRLAIFTLRECTERPAPSTTYSTRTTSPGGILATRESTARAT